MAQLMLVNPRRRKRRRSTSTARRRRNPRRMTAKQAKYFAPKRRTRRRRHNPVATLSPRRRHRRTRRRNPLRARTLARSFTPRNLLQGTVMPAALGAAGALAFDVAWAMAPIPATIKTGPLSPVVKIAGAVGAGMLASKFVGKKFGSAVTAGAVLVTLYDVVKNIARTNFPTLPLSEYVDGIGYVQAGPFLPAASHNGLGAYVSGANPQGGTLYMPSSGADLTF